MAYRSGGGYDLLDLRANRMGTACSQWSMPPIEASATSATGRASPNLSK
jgi:hypothetical protein